MAYYPGSVHTASKVMRLASQYISSHWRKDLLFNRLLRRQKEVRNEKHRWVWSINQYVVCTIYFMTSKTSNKFLVIYKRQFTGKEPLRSGLGLWSFKEVGLVVLKGYVRRRFTVRVYSSKVDRGQIKRVSVCRWVTRHPGPLVRAGILYGIEQVLSPR